METPSVVAELASNLRALGWVSDLLVGGSVATGDYRAGVSDVDLVALIERPLDMERRSAIVAIHRRLDATTAAGADLGCAYVASSTLSDWASRHPTWTHGQLIERPLSGIVRAELTGYWSSAVRHPWWWLDPTIADLGLVTMARARHALATGNLVTKTSAIDAAHAPGWLREDLHARRSGRPVRSPRLRTAWVAWSDARRTTAAARR